MKLSDCGIFGFMLALILGILGMAVAMPFSSVELDGEASVAEVDAEPVLVIIENVATRGGLEVFPEPDRASGRIFAAAANFTPHVAGINAEGDWLLILYFDNGALVAGWSPLSQLVLTDEEISTLVVVNPQNLPTLPTEIAGDTTSASRPYGTSAGSNPEPTDTTLWWGRVIRRRGWR